MKKSKLQDRRDFIKYAGLGAFSVTGGLPILGSAMNENEFPVSNELITFNGFNIELLYQSGYFIGLGKIDIDGTLLRSGRLPMFADITSPDAISLTNYKVLRKSIEKDAVAIEFSTRKLDGDMMEWMLHTVRNRRNMSDWTKHAEDMEETSLLLKIRPVDRLIGSIRTKGFSYQYSYKSSNLPIYKITDRASWEIDGSAKGNQFWMRNGVVDSIPAFNSKDDFYSTEWYLPGIANPNIFQFHPLQTHLQGFTFTASEKGILITFPSRVAHIRSLFEKWRGENEIVHFHEHCDDLSNSFETSPVEVLWIAGNFDRIHRANIYNEVREMVHEELHGQIEMRRERITTYGIIEEWTDPDFDAYTENILPKILDTGVKTIFIPSQCQNDMNTWGLSNMCCNVDFKIAETVGEDKLKNFCSVAQKAGAKVEMWGNTAISTTTERFMHHEGKAKGIQFLPYKNSIMEVIRRSKSPFVRNASNAIEADHYTPRFCALNLRDKDIRAYWMQQWKYFHDEIGIEGIFLDSSFNMSSDKFHHSQYDGSEGWRGATLDQKELLGKYRPEKEAPKIIQTQYHAHLSWVVEMQKMGYQYCAEDMGVFGVNRTGPDVLDRISSLPIWADSYCNFEEKKIQKAGYDPMLIFFKGLAYRMMWKLTWDFKKNKLKLGTENQAAFKLLKIYNEVNDLLYGREILEGEKGVVYRKYEKVILWGFEDFAYPLNDKGQIENLTQGVNYVDSSVQVEKLNVYRITPLS